MKKVFTVAVSLLSVFILSAQEGPSTQDSLQAYVGKYLFPKSENVKQVDISVENSVLYGSSDAGRAEFKKTAKADVFELVEISGLATFKRNAEGKVIELKIEGDEWLLEGTKSEAANAPSPADKVHF